MNDLPQTKCDPNDYISVDCRWFKTLAYLHKKGVRVHIERPRFCDLSALTSSVAVASRCIGRTALSTNSAENGVVIDAIRYQIKIEPEVDQVLIEGDTLELICRFKKLSSRKAHFLNSDLRWAKRDSRGFVTWLSGHRFKQTRAEVKLKNELIIESKFTMQGPSSADSAKYFCSTVNSQNSALTGLNSSEVEFKIMNNKIIMSEIQKADVFCPEKLIQTYKGNYKWPRTYANNIASINCKVNPESSATLQCLSNGEWSNEMGLVQCHFESNLTRQLEALANSKEKVDIDSMLRNFASSLGQVSPFDVIFSQRLLISATKIISRRQVLLFADLLAKLGIACLNQAKALDPFTFSNFFYQVILFKKNKLFFIFI